MKKRFNNFYEDNISDEFKTQWLPIIYIFLSLLGTVGQATCMHYSSQNLPFMEVIIATNITIFLVIATMTKYKHGRMFLPVVSKWKMFIRCFIGLTSLGVVLLTLKYFELFLQQSFRLVPNILVGLIGLVFYKEVMSKLSKKGLALGCLGILLLVGEALLNVSPDKILYLGIPIFMVVLQTAIIIYIKEILKTDTVHSLTFYYSFGLLVESAIIVPFVDDWQSILDWRILLSLIGTGISAAVMQVYRNKALQEASLSTFAAFNPFALVFTAIFGYLFFDEIPRLTMFIAALLIVVAAYIFIRGKEVKENKS